MTRRPGGLRHPGWMGGLEADSEAATGPGQPPRPSPSSRLALIAGVDEAGRGPLAGPVTAAAVILDPARPIHGLDDSKRLSTRRRQSLAVEIREGALAWCLASASPAEIDQLNILQASLLAMRRAVAGLSPQPSLVQVDGNRCPQLTCPVEAIVGGDARIAAIAAASILAKVSRDEEMTRLDLLYPGYGLAVHKGYPTADHLAALTALGPSPIHRRSFRPVREVGERADGSLSSMGPPGHPHREPKPPQPDLFSSNPENTLWMSHDEMG